MTDRQRVLQALRESRNPREQPHSNGHDPSFSGLHRRKNHKNSNHLKGGNASGMKAVVNKSKIDALYSVMNKRYRKLGGNAGGGAIYGEVTAASFSKIVGNFKEFCELSENSTFGEFGSGLG